MHWLPKAMRILRDERPDVDVSVSSNYSPDLADALSRGRLDLAFLRAEPGFDLEYAKLSEEPLIVLMPSDHPLTAQVAIHPQDLVGSPFVGMANKARVLRSVLRRLVADSYKRRSAR